MDQHPAHRYHSLTYAFVRFTGVPLVLNTSFNVKRRFHLLQSPERALRAIYTCALDVLYLGRPQRQVIVSCT